MNERCMSISLQWRDRRRDAAWHHRGTWRFVLLSKVVRTLYVFALLGLFLVSAPAWGQTNDEVNAGVQFNFTPPGARSLGLGGAFLATADDATAAVTNPAGLIGLTRMEFSIEGLYEKLTHQFSDFGHAFGDPTGDGIDVIGGVQTGGASSNLFGISFLSVVYPGDDRWSMAMYRHEIVNFETAYQRQGVFFNSIVTGVPPGDLRRVFPAIADIDLHITNYGVAGGYQVSKSVSLGAAVYIGDFGIASSMQRFDPRQGGRGAAGRALVTQPANYSPENLANAQFQSGADRRLGLTFGGLWVINDQWRLGGVARPGPKYDYDVRDTIGPNDPSGTPGTLKSLPATFKVPDQYGIGLSYQPTTNWRVNLDYDRIQYSQMTDNLTKILSDRSDDVTAEDSNEFHVGVEYSFLRRSPIVIRGGMWYEPDHRMVYRGIAQSEVEQREQIVFRPGDDLWHVSGGAGMIFADRYLLDAALDYSDLRTQATLYFTVQFGNPGASTVLAPENATTGAGTRKDQ